MISVKIYRSEHLRLKIFHRVQLVCAGQICSFKAYFWPDTKHGVQISNRTPMPPKPFLCANPNPLKCYQFRLILKSLDRVHCFNWLQYSFASSYICISTLCPQNLDHKQQKLLAQQAKPFCLRNSYPKIALFCTCVHKIMQDALLGVD